MSTAATGTGAARAMLVDWLAHHGTTADEIVETHMSVLVFCGQHVYKVKKPVHFAFADLSTLDLRRHNTEQELALNRRLAPDVYERLVDITNADARVVDVALRMRRLDPASRLSMRVASGGGRECTVAVASKLARFHDDHRGAADAVSSWINAAGSYDSFSALWTAGFAQWSAFTDTILPAATIAEIEALALEYLRGRRALFDERVARGRIVDGHGDLLADDIFCEPDGPRVIDCLEFDRTLRAGDALLDAAFLAMDLEALGRPDLARDFLDAYRAASGDSWPPSLQHHFIAYRAHVRAKVACLRAEQGDPDASNEAVSRCDLALAHLRAARIRVVLVGGLPGSGKSTVARALAEARAAALLRSDEIRKDLLGVSSSDHRDDEYRSGAYDPTTTNSTYAEMLRRATDHLARGTSVVLDASWSDARLRADAAAVARAADAAFIELRCDAPAPLCRARLLDRRRRNDDVSDARPEIHDAMAQRFAPWPSAQRIDTTAPSAESTAAARMIFDDGGSL
jgi:aminoglycoside phosphotransferase family enzyme/predicted kinase